MSTLYVAEQGSVLHKDGLQLSVTKDGACLQKTPAAMIDQVVIFGAVGLTTPVINHLLQTGVDCVFCSRDGRYRGRLFSTETNFGALRTQQYAAHLDPTVRMAVARSIVGGKLSNQRTLMLRHRRDHEAAALDAAVDILERCLARVERADSRDALMGLEGAAAAAYFEGMRALLKADLGFARRARRPPPDPINAMLSFGYMLLLNEVQNAVRVVGLDPFTGFLHAHAYSRPSLALDLMEEFRPIIVDSVVLRMVNTGMVAEEDFEPSGAEEATRRSTMRPEFLKRFLGEFERRLATAAQHPHLKKSYTYRQCFEQQARLLAGVIRGDRPEYLPFVVR
ncbi:MAG: CRISPR-associated endonuclease Cas1 [Chloroflexi bacterium]|nr:CRISPR-associated endonuclease Cas1 [Chloroflexota bacterium]